MINTIIYLIGHQGVGKLTIGRAIHAATGAALLDNHLLANPVFTAVANDSVSGIPPAIKAKIGAVRNAVFAAAAEDAAADLSYVLTDVLLDDELGRRRWEEAKALAAARRATLVPVLLSCDDDAEYARRVTDPARIPQLKQVDLPRSLERRATRPLLPIAHPNTLPLEVGRLAAEEAARQIIAHAGRLAP